MRATTQTLMSAQAATAADITSLKAIGLATMTPATAQHIADKMRWRRSLS